MTVDYLKENFLTRVETREEKDENGNKEKKRITIKCFEDLNLTDDDLKKFIGLLSIDINATKYEIQEAEVMECLSKKFSCKNELEKDYLYNNCLRQIKTLAGSKDIFQRKITKNKFIDLINSGERFFNSLFMSKIGIKKYNSYIKSKFFSNVNMLESERFFVFDGYGQDLVDIKKNILFDL